MSAYAGVNGINRARTMSSGSGGPNDADNTKRRSSSRNIKRPKFDDELVESSLGGQGVPPLPKFRARNISMSVPDSPAPTPAPAQTTTADVRKRVAVKASANISNKRSRKGKHSSVVPTKDLGRWKPTDDLTLILGVQQTCDLIAVHRGIKFSCKFTLAEIQERWYNLLYDPTVSRVAQQAMKNLHPEQISAIQAKALYSKAEEDLLCTVKCSPTPTVETFQSLMQLHPEVFHVGRTAKHLLAHWQQLKQYYLLPDQNPLSTHRREFAETEEQMMDYDLYEPPDVALNNELSVMSKQNKAELRKLEDKVAHLSVLVDTVTGITPPDFDTNTLAILRGRLVRYLMRSENITLGRKAPDVNIDVDLTLEGPAWKISRRQGIISLRANGEFVLQNEGKRAIFVDGKPVITGACARLLNNTVIEIAALKFIFLINAALVNKSIVESGNIDNTSREVSAGT